MSHWRWDGEELDLSSRRFVVTGGAGFLGTFVVEELQRRGAEHVFVPRSEEFDLRERSAIERMLEIARPDVVIHLAAVVGGIGANRDNPGRFFYDNLIMGTELIEQCRLFGVEKTVVAGTICAYPKFATVPFREEDLWSGYPEETNAPYGIAKKALLVQLQAYRQQYGMSGIYLLPVNLYGPNDNFDLETSHVIPAMIRKCIEAREAGRSKVELWGDGSPTREFLHARDAAEGIVTAAARYDGPEPVNLGTGHEISIRDLAKLVKKHTGFMGEFDWRTDKPNGQPRRRLSVERAKEYFGWEARIPFEEGLRETIAWYESVR
ncbi:MAG: GDP-L-fucose synthase family protein [Myxococcota bacterium]